MLYWWLHSNRAPLERWGWVSAEETHVYLTLRITLAALAAFLIAILTGPWAIAWLQRHFRERIDSASAKLNELHAMKHATPSMGGVFLVAGIVGAAALFADLTSPYVHQAIVVVLLHGVLGAADDWIKTRSTRRGLTAAQKLLGQLAAGLLIVGWMQLTTLQDPARGWLILPVGGRAIPLGMLVIVWGLLVIVGSSNGVNLTDGLDGLAAGCLVLTGSAFTVLAYLAGHRVLAEYLAIPHVPGAGELAVVLGAMVGAVLGFLWFNCYPAMVFMGDAGSLPTGALLGYVALAIHQELLLAVAGGIFVIETLSVIGQVGWFKLTGRRIIACSPLHNHYLFQGRHEVTIVVRFWIIAALCALLAIASLKLR